MAPTLVLVHGGGFDSRCWDPTIALLSTPAAAIDLPGRGTRPVPLAEVHLTDFVGAIVDELVDADLRDVVLVGHSLAGVSLPGAAAAVPERIRRLVFVSCTVPPHGQSVVDTLEPEIQALATANRDATPRPVDPAIADMMFGNDMDDRQRAWMHERLVAEAPASTFDPVDLDGPWPSIPRTWIRLLQDQVVAPAKQDRFVEVLGGCEVVDLDAGHMAMITRPAELAALLDGIASEP